MLNLDKNLLTGEVIAEVKELFDKNTLVQISIKGITIETEEASQIAKAFESRITM